jgi:hypothetical protein
MLVWVFMTPCSTWNPHSTIAWACVPRGQMSAAGKRGFACVTADRAQPYAVDRPCDIEITVNQVKGVKQELQK